MSLKAGRVGVNPADVDPINGHISPESLSGYTKQEADAKFETQTSASAEYAKLQPKTLSVPIEMLSGSKLTVETALQGLQSDKIDNAITETAFTEIVGGASVDTSYGGNHIVKQGKMVTVDLGLTAVDATAWTTKIAQIPDGYKPKYENFSKSTRNNYTIKIGTNGGIYLGDTVTGAGVYLHTSWFTE